MGKGEIIKRKTDISPFLFHWTSKNDAKEKLKCIINEEKLRSDRNDFICFTETPAKIMKGILEYFSRYYDPMFGKYAIGIRRDTLYSCGARPVIYGDKNDFELLPEELKWRYVPFTENVDWTWQREWRINQNPFDFSRINTNDIVIIAPKEEIWEFASEVELKDVDFDYENEIRDCIMRPIFAEYRKYKAVSYEDVDSFDDDNQMKIFTDGQSIGEEIS